VLLCGSGTPLCFTGKEVLETCILFGLVWGTAQTSQVLMNERFKGSKQGVRDKDHGIKDKDFGDWWHRKGKKVYGGEDLSGDDAEGVYDDWVAEGKPRGSNDKPRKPRR
jgi:hypothetical protein